MALVESLKILLTKAGRNDNSGAHQEQSLVCGELVSEVPVRPGHSRSMPPLVWPSLLSELVDRAKNEVFPGGILEFGYPGLAEGNVVDSHIQFDFPRGSSGAPAQCICEQHFLPWSVSDGHIIPL